MKDSDPRMEQLQQRAAQLLQADVFDADPDTALTMAQLVEQLVIHQTELRMQNLELVHAQQVASTALAEYASLFESLPLAAFVVDDRSVVQIANTAASTLLGRRRPEELIGQRLLLQIAPASQAGVARALTAAPRTPARVSGIQLAQHLRRDAHDVHLIALADDEHGRRRHLLLLVDRGPDAERLRLATVNEALLDLRRASQDPAPSRLLAVAVRWLERLSGCARCAWFDTSSAEPTLLAWSSIASRADMTIARLREAVIAAARAARNPRRDEVPEQTPIGEQVVVCVPAEAGPLAAVLLLPRGTVLAPGALPSVEALTDELSLLLHLHKGQQELARLSQALEQSNDALVITDDAGAIRYANSSFARLIGIDPGEQVGRDLVELFGGEGSPLSDGWRALRERGAWQGEVTAPGSAERDAPVHVALSSLRDPRGQIDQYICWFVDLSERKLAEQQIHQLAYFDALTGLPNRRFLGYRIQQAIAAFARTQVCSAVLFIDLDGFKHVNDSLGHDQGDLLLCAVAERIGGCVRDVDTVARLGGDEFVVLLPEISPTTTGACTAAETIAKRIVAAVSRPIELSGRAVATTPSIGIAVVDASAPSADHLLRHADLAMYQAKAAGRNTVRFFDQAMQTQADVRASLHTALQQALEEGQLELFLQPQIDVDRAVVGHEALLRWRHPTRGLVPPSTFIPLAEDTGLIISIGEWVLREACTVLAGRRAAGAPATTLAVNVSARQLRTGDLVATVDRILTDTGAPPDQLELELTESMFLHDVDEAVAMLLRLRDLGVRIALDDFGTGYSSLAYLQRLPLSKLKIDRRFVAGLPDDAADRGIVRAIIAMVHSLGLPVLAEGVETEAQHAFLARGRCDYFQGFLHGMPARIELP